MTASAEEMTELKAAIGEATMSFGGLDNAMVVLLSAMLAPSLSEQLEFASIIIFRARSVDQRLEILRDVLEFRLSGFLSHPHYHFERRCADFALKAFNVTATEINTSKWIRNLAAHGNMIADAPPKLIPPMFDGKARRLLAERKPEYAGGITAKQISEECNNIRRAETLVGSLSGLTSSLIYSGPEGTFLKEAEKLAADLGIDPPRRPKTRPTSTGS